MVKLDSLEEFATPLKNLNLASAELEEVTTMVEIELANTN